MSNLQEDCEEWIEINYANSSAYKQSIIKILFDSFKDNQSIQYAVKQDKKKEKRFNALLEYSFYQGLNFGKIYINKERNTCAILLFPHSKKGSVSSTIQDIKLLFKSVGVKNISKLLKREKLIHSFHPSNAFIHLWYIGVKPSLQGNGKGTELMKKIIALSQQEKMPIYLETSTERNHAFYQRLGMKVIASFDELGYPLKMYALNN